MSDRCLGPHASKNIATRRYSLSQGNERLIIFPYVASGKNLFITKYK